MKKIPRPYQIDCVDRTARSLAEHQATILHAPTGAGKSLMCQMIVDRCIAKGRTVLVLSDARKIFDQLVEELGPIEIKSDVKQLAVKKGECYCGMIQTLLRRPMILKQLKDLGDGLVLIVDECHISTSTKLIDELPNAYRIGLTATPYGLWHKHLPEYYNDLVEGPQVDFLIQSGYLTNYRHYARTPADTSLLKIRNGEYTEKSQESVFSARAVYDGLFEDLRSFTFRKCVIFVASIKQAEALYEKLNAAGFRASRYHSGLKYAEYELAKFEELDMADILVTIKSLSKGWDYKPIDMVALMHKTKSTSLYQQEIGRGARIFPGKEIFTVLDYGNNWKDHGLYFEDRPYSELWNMVKPPKETEQASSSKSCPSCESIIAISATKCKYCGYQFPIEEKRMAQGELIDLTDEYHVLVGKKVSELSPGELANYCKIKNKKAYAIRVAKAQEQLRPGFLLDFAAEMGYKRNWVYTQHIPNERIDFMDITLR